MIDLLTSPFSEQIATAVEYLRWFAGITFTVVAVYLAVILSGFFFPRVSSAIRLINRLFAGTLLLVLAGGAAFLYFNTPETRVVTVPTLQFTPPSIVLPELPELPEIPLQEIAESVGDAVGTVAEGAADVLSDVADELTPEPPTPEDLERQARQWRLQQQKQAMRAEVEMAYQRLLQASQSVGHAFGSGSWGLPMWQSSFSSSGRRNSLQRQQDAAVNRLAREFQRIEDDLFANLYAIRHGEPASRAGLAAPVRASGGWGPSISQKVRECKDNARRYALKQRRETRGISRANIASQMNQWRAESLHEELAFLAGERRNDWIEEIGLLYKIQL